MPKLSDFGFNRYSQFGEDGIIEKVFEIIGTSSKICVEFGAWDGFYFANTANLWTNGWQGILIEADSRKYQALVRNVEDHNCICIRERVTSSGANTIEQILQRAEVDQTIDLLSIDIDGDDYYIFESLKTLRPRVIICEYNPTIPAELELIPPRNNYFGCSVSALVSLAEEKGYKLVALTDANCIFVVEELYSSFADFQTSLEKLKITEHLTYLITGFDGSYIASREPIYGFSYPSRYEFIGTYHRLRGIGFFSYRLKQLPIPTFFRMVLGRIKRRLLSTIKHTESRGDI